MRIFSVLLCLVPMISVAVPPPPIQYNAATTNKLVVAGSNVNFSLSGTTLSVNSKTDTNVVNALINQSGVWTNNGNWITPVGLSLNGIQNTSDLSTNGPGSQRVVLQIQDSPDQTAYVNITLFGNMSGSQTNSPTAFFDMDAFAITGEESELSISNNPKTGKAPDYQVLRWIDYTLSPTLRFGFQQDGNISPIRGVFYNFPPTNALPGQALVSDGGTPQQLSWVGAGEPFTVDIITTGRFIGNGIGITNLSQLKLAVLTTNMTTTSASLSAVGLNNSLALAASTTYSVDAYFFVSDSVAADGAQIDFGAGGATAGDFRMHVTSFDSALRLSTQLTSLTGAASIGTLTGSSVIECHGTITTSGPGTFIPRFAQAAHSTGTLTLFQGSRVEVKVLQ